MEVDNPRSDKVKRHRQNPRPNEYVAEVKITFDDPTTASGSSPSPHPNENSKSIMPEKRGNMKNENGIKAAVQNGHNTNGKSTDEDKEMKQNGKEQQATVEWEPVNGAEEEGRPGSILGKRSMTISSPGVALIDGTNYVKRVRNLSVNAELPNKLNEPTYTPSPLKDPWCDPDHPKVLQFQDISAAAYKIQCGVMKTPCTRSDRLSTMLGMDIFFKKEFLHVTGSFKERGARYTLSCLSQEQKATGVIAASAGNHALALAYHGQSMGIPVTVVMPLIAPLMKITNCRSYGATVLVKGEDIGEAKEIAMKMAEEHGYVYVNGYDHPHIMAGQGTVGLEIIEEVGQFDAVIIPVGGAGLIAGTALAIKHLLPTAKVIGVEGEKCPSLTKAFVAGHPTYTKIGSTIADGLSVPVVGVNAFKTIQAHNLVDQMLTIPEEYLALAILKLIEIEKAVVEGGGAIGLAAILANKLPELRGKRVVCVLTGGNIDSTILGRAIERALAEDGRLIRFVAVVSDRPGGIAELTSLLARLGASIKDMYHERAWLKNDIFNVRVKVTAETRDMQHAKEVEDALNAHYNEVVFNPII